MIKKINISEAESFLKNNFSSPTHWPEWNLLVSKHYNSKWYYWGYFKSGILEGLCPIHELKHKKFLKLAHSGQFNLIPNGGWIFSKHTEVGAHIFSKLSNLLTQSIIFTLPIIDEFNVNYYGKNLVSKSTLVIDLRKANEQIWQNDIHSKRRNMIRKAEKEGVEIVEMKDRKGLTDFYNLYSEASGKFSKHQLSFSFFEEMFFNQRNIQIHLYAAYKENIQLANVGIVSDKDYSFYWLGNNKDGNINIGQGELLQWHVINKMKEKGCKYYDLCYIEPERLPQIYKFKKGFSNDEKTIWIINHKPLPFKILNKII